MIVVRVNVSSDVIYLVPIQDPYSYDQGAYPDTGYEVQDEEYDEDYEQITQLRTTGRSSRVSSMQRVLSVSSSIPSMNSSRTLCKNSWTKTRTWFSILPTNIPDTQARSTTVRTQIRPDIPLAPYYHRLGGCRTGLPPEGLIAELDLFFSTLHRNDEMCPRRAGRSEQCHWRDGLGKYPPFLKSQADYVHIIADDHLAGTYRNSPFLHRHL